MPGNDGGLLLPGYKVFKLINMEKISLLILAVAAIILVIYLWAVIDMNRRKFSSESERRNWINLVYFLPLLGAFYYLIRRNKRRKSI